ncbi:hypothetical protein ANAEL_04667 [Anaerolineales bacterium]|nr:hypothetical protein ANAEL_04667 [Anaerolineales bacterium]
METIENEKSAGGVETIAAADEAKREHYAMLLKRFPCNSPEAQSMRLYHALQFAPVDTLEARSGLDILHPAARCMELRTRYIIDTVWVTRHTSEGKPHRVAMYVLQGGVCHE